MNQENKTAVFIDAENINDTKVYPLVFKNLISQGYNPLIRIMVISQISDEFKDINNIIKENSLDLVISYKQIHSKKERNKNNADFRLYIEVCKILFSPQYSDINTFVILSSDEGFSELILLLKKHGKKVIGVGNRGKGRQVTSSEYKELFDNNFYFVEDLLEVENKRLQEEALKNKPLPKKRKVTSKTSPKKEKVVQNNNTTPQEIPLEKNEKFYKNLSSALKTLALKKKRCEFSEVKNFLAKRKLNVNKEDLEKLNIIITQDGDKEFVKLDFKEETPPSINETL